MTMIDADLDRLAQTLYDTAPSRAHSPAWDQLGDTTKGVWRERVGALPQELPLPTCERVTLVVSPALPKRINWGKT